MPKVKKHIAPSWPNQTTTSRQQLERNSDVHFHEFNAKIKKREGKEWKRKKRNGFKQKKSKNKIKKKYRECDEETT